MSVLSKSVEARDRETGSRAPERLLKLGGLITVKL